MAEEPHYESILGVLIKKAKLSEQPKKKIDYKAELTEK